MNISILILFLLFSLKSPAYTGFKEITSGLDIFERDSYRKMPEWLFMFQPRT